MERGVAVVTGGAAGLGAVIAATLAQRGQLVVIADRDASVAEDLVAELRHRGGRAVSVPTDLSEERELRELMRRVPTFGRLALLVNNAGGWLPGPQFPDNDDWRRSLELNLVLPMLATQLALPLMAEHGGAVVNVSSSGGLDSGAYGSPEYGAAKAGLIRFTTSVSDFAERYGVRVSCVVPHWIGLPRAIEEYGRMSAEEQAASGGLVDPQVVADEVLRLAADPEAAGKVVELRGDIQRSAM